MIALPELLIVIGVFALMLGYIAFLRYLLSHADNGVKNNSSTSRPPKA